MILRKTCQRKVGQTTKHTSTWELSPLKVGVITTQQGRLVGITSSVTETEVALDLASTGNRDKIDDALRLIEGMENLTICPLGSYVARLAVKLVLDSGLGLHDAYHSATALENKAGIFVTRDKSLRNKLKKTIGVSEPESIPKGS